MSHTYTLREFADMLKNVRERYDFPRLEIKLGSDQARDLEVEIHDTLETNARLHETNTKLREAVEALSKELTTEAQSMMRQPEAGVIRSIAERLHGVVFRRQWRDKR